MTSELVVFGATGFAGSHFAEAAETRGFEVTRVGHRQATGWSCDILDPRAVRDLIARTQPRIVVNLAGAASVGLSWADPSSTFQINATGTLHILDAVAKETTPAHVLCVSSGEAYGFVEPRSQPIDETQALNPVSPYGVSKAALEAICAQHRRAHGMKITVCRSFNHFGPGQDDRFIASNFARQIAEAERDGEAQLELRVGDLSPARDFTDVRDVVRAYALLLEREATGSFNVCSGQAVPLREIVECLAEKTRLSITTRAEPARMRGNEAPVISGSTTKLRQTTAWEPVHSFAQSLGDVLEWWRSRVATASKARRDRSGSKGDN